MKILFIGNSYTYYHDMPECIFAPMAKEAGLLAMETRYSLFDDQTTRLAQTLAEEFGLLPSGGSDFHGTNKPDISLGTGRGGLRVPAEYYEALKSVSRL